MSQGTGQYAHQADAIQMAYTATDITSLTSLFVRGGKIRQADVQSLMTYVQAAVSHVHTWNEDYYQVANAMPSGAVTLTGLGSNGGGFGNNGDRTTYSQTTSSYTPLDTAGVLSVSPGTIYSTRILAADHNSMAQYCNALSLHNHNIGDRTAT